MTDTIKVLHKKAGKTMRLKSVPNTLEACQELVGGDIQVVRLMPGVILVCNEEGLIRELPENPYCGRMFFGDWFICGEIGDEFDDVPREYVKLVRKFMTVREERKNT